MYSWQFLLHLIFINVRNLWLCVEIYKHVQVIHHAPSKLRLEPRLRFLKLRICEHPAEAPCDECKVLLRGSTELVAQNSQTVKQGLPAPKITRLNRM